MVISVYDNFSSDSDADVTGLYGLNAKDSCYVAVVLVLCIMIKISKLIADLCKLLVIKLVLKLDQMVDVIDGIGVHDYYHATVLVFHVLSLASDLIADLCKEQCMRVGSFIWLLQWITLLQILVYDAVRIEYYHDSLIGVVK